MRVFSVVLSFHSVVFGVAVPNSNALPQIIVCNLSAHLGLGFVLARLCPSSYDDIQTCQQLPCKVGNSGTWSGKWAFSFTRRFIWTVLQCFLGHPCTCFTSLCCAFSAAKKSGSHCRIECLLFSRPFIIHVAKCSLQLVQQTGAFIFALTM